MEGIAVVEGAGVEVGGELAAVIGVGWWRWWWGNGGGSGGDCEV